MKNIIKIHIKTIVIAFLIIALVLPIPATALEEITAIEEAFLYGMTTDLVPHNLVQSTAGGPYHCTLCGYITYSIVASKVTEEEMQ